MAVTIRQIARAAGVSRGTVDRALNSRSGIKPEKVEHVLRVAAELGYKPNLAAKMLSDKQHSIIKIGIALVTEHNPFYDDVLRGIRTALEEYADFGIENMIHIQQDYSDIKQQIKALEAMEAQGVRGIVMNPIHCPEVAAKINALFEHGIRVVTINSDITQSNRIAYVGCHDRQSGEVLAGLLGLIANGLPMKVGVIAGPTHNLAVIRRKSGMLETLATNYPNIEVTSAYENENNEELSYQLTHQMLASHPTLDTLCVLGSGIIGCLNAVRERNAVKRTRVIVYDLIQEVRQALLDGVVDATITQEPFRQGYDGVQIIAKYLAFNQLPDQELNYTSLSILTRYCL